MMRAGWSRRRNKWVAAGAAALVASAVVAALAAPDAQAHSPHDVVSDVELSPEFRQDRTAYAIVREYLLRSDDGGDTWVRLVRGLDNQGQLSAVEISPTNKKILYVSSRGDGLYRSGDGGRTWSRPAGRLPGLNIDDITVSPHSADVLVAAFQEADRRSLAITHDGGASWRPLRGLPRPSVVTFAPEDPAILLVGSSDGAIRRSHDGGATWAEVFRADGAGAITTVAYAPGDEGFLFVGTREGGLWRSETNGQSFTRMDGEMAEDGVQSLAFSPNFAADRTMWLSTWSSGAFQSDNGGTSWSPFSDGLTTNRQADLLDGPSFGQLRSSEGVVFLAAFDGLFRSNGSDGWQEVETQVSTNIASVAISPNYERDHTLAVATYLNGVLLSVDGGSTWRAINDGLSAEATWKRSDDYFARLFGIAFSPSFATDRMLFTSERGFVLRSTEAGARWNASTPDGLLVEGEHPPDYPLFVFSPNYHQDATVLLGTNRGKVFRSTNGGSSYAKVAQLDAPISALAAARSLAPDIVLFAGTTAGLQRSHDGGETWEPVGPFTNLVTSVAASPEPASDHRIFVGTSQGLFLSSDGGDTWARSLDRRFGRESFIEAMVLSPAFATDGIILVSVRGRGLFRSVDGGASFAAAGEQLFADGYVIGNFYQETSEPIVFSPGFSQDQTVFGIAETKLFRSVDGGNRWEAIVLPLTTHPAEVPVGQSPLLPSAPYAVPNSTVPGFERDDRSFETPVGRLAPTQILVALGAAGATFLLLSVPQRARLAAHGRSISRSARVVLALLVLVLALLVIAA